MRPTWARSCKARPASWSTGGRKARSPRTFDTYSAIKNFATAYLRVAEAIRDTMRAAAAEGVATKTDIARLEGSQDLRRAPQFRPDRRLSQTAWNRDVTAGAATSPLLTPETRQ